MAKKRQTEPPLPATPAVPPAPTAGPRWPIALILIFSTVLGFVAVLQFHHSPFHGLPMLDEESYYRWGMEIAGGDWVGQKIFYQDPLYPYFLGLVFSIFGPRLALVRLIQVLLGALAVWLTYASGRRLYGWRGGLAAAGVLAMCGSLYFFELLLLKALLVIVLGAAAVYFGTRAATEPDSRIHFFLAGLMLGLLCLLRGNFLGLLPFALIWAWVVAPGGPKLRAVRTALLAAGAALVIFPVTVRNRAVGGEWVLTTSQGGANFYIGNNPDAPGYYGVLSFVRADPKFEADDFRAEAERRVKRPLTPSEVSGFWFREGFQWIADHPGTALRLTLHKARLLIHQFEVPDNYSFALTRDYFVSALKLPFLGIGWLWGPALAAVWLLRRDRRLWFPAGLAILYAASIIPFFIVDRYRTPLLVPAALLTAGLVMEVARRLRSREVKGLGVAAAIMAAGLSLGLWPTAESRSSAPIAAYNIGNAWFDQGQFEEAIRWYRYTLQELPDHLDSLRNIEAAEKYLEDRHGRTRP